MCVWGGGYNVVTLTFSAPFGLFSSDISSESRVRLNPGLGGMRDITFSSIARDQMLLNQVCCFQTV